MIFSNRLNISIYNNFFQKSYPLDLLDIKNNCVLGISPYKRLTREYDDWLVYVVRVNDLEESYFYHDESGNINSSEINTWLAGSNGVVKKIANPLKYSNPAYQNTLSDMPRIVNSGTFDSDGPYYDGVDDNLKIDDYTELGEITEPPYSLYVDVVGGSGVDSIFTITLDSHDNSQIYLAHWAHRLSWWHNGIDLTNSNVFVVGATNKILGTWANKAGNGLKVRTSISEYVRTLDTTLPDRPNINLGARSDSVDGLTVTSFFTGNIKTALLFNTDEYDKYDDLVNLGL